MSIKHLSTLMFLVPILLGANNSHGPVGKTYKALVNETCKSMTDGGCMIYTYQVLKFEQDSVKVSYQAIASCSPKEMEDNYKEMYKNQIKKYKWTVQNDTLTVEGFDTYGKFLFQDSVLIGRDKFKNQNIEFLEQVKQIDIIAKQAKTEFLNSLRNSFTIADISEIRNITFTNYDLRFCEEYGAKLKKINSELKPEDYEFFIAQINEYEKLEIDSMELDFKLQDFNFITQTEMLNLGRTYDVLWGNFIKKYGEKSLLRLSKPLLSRDFQLAILEIQFITESSINIVSELYAFKRVNGEWVLLSEL
jgi:hypothetical protein